MDTTRGRELQERIGLDALTQWTLFGTATDTGMQERCIRIVGKTWDIPEEETQAWLDAIARERSYAESGSSEHVRPDDELPVNLSGLETLNMTWDLFETAVQLDDQEQREALFRLASELAETQNLLDWILKTPEEQELPETAES